MASPAQQQLDTAPAAPATAQADAPMAKAATTKLKPTPAAMLANDALPTTPVKAAWFGGLDFHIDGTSAQAAAKTFRIEGFADITLRDVYNLSREDFDCRAF